MAKGGRVSQVREGKRSRIDVRTIRRSQIVEAAVAVITEQGIQNLSLSEIEKKAGMSRGQLTYYFPAKEEILLAAFDRLLEMIRSRCESGHGKEGPTMPAGWDRATVFLTKFLLDPPDLPEFRCLQYTFLSQLGHREDFRDRLAKLYEEWRGKIALDLAEPLAKKKSGLRVSSRTMATLLQAILHGLTMQRAADEAVFEPREMLALVLDLFERYLAPKGVRANGQAASQNERQKPPLKSAGRRSSSSLKRAES